MTSNLSKHRELVIITEHFAPSTSATAQLVSDLALDLYSSGVRLRVLTSTPGGSLEYPFPIYRLSLSAEASLGVLQKLFSGVRFSIHTLAWLFLNLKPNHSVLIVSNPPFIGLIGILLSILKSTRYAFLFQDLFPRSAVLTGILPAQGPLYFIWRLLIKSVLSRSNLNIVLSEAMLKRCRLDFNTAAPLISIPNWAVLPPQTHSKHQSPLSKQWDLENSFTIQYSGNFGRLHEILIILESARLLRHESVKFVFVGGGAKLCQIVEYCSSYNLSNVLIKPYQPRSSLSDSLAACDVSLVSLIPGAEDTVAPSKIYGILASSRPVILISSDHSELALTLTRSCSGLVVPHGDVTLLAETILYLSDNPDVVSQMGLNARSLYDRDYGRVRSTKKYYRALKRYGFI